MWDASATLVPVLLVTGPIGVGKTAVLREADALLVAAGAGHATVELEEIARCWPDATEISRSRLVYGNLAALWSNFAALGTSRLLLAGLIAQRSDLRLVSEAVPGAAVTVVRLHTPLGAGEADPSARACACGRRDRRDALVDAALGSATPGGSPGRDRWPGGRRRGPGRASARWLAALSYHDRRHR